MSLKRLLALITVCLALGCSSNSNNDNGTTDDEPQYNPSSSTIQLSSSSSITPSSSSVKPSSSSITQSSSSVITGLRIDCTRQGLTNAVSTYLAALTAGDHTLMPLTSSAKYYENDHTAPYNGNKAVPFGEGLWKTPLAPDHYMNLIDVDECATFTEVILASTKPQYILGVRLKVSGNQISDVFAVVTYEGHWLFNADNYLRYSKAEDWSLLPENQRLTRQELKNGAEAYFKYFSDKTVEVPWGIPCARLEGGAYTGDRPTSTCNVGVPDLNMSIPTIWWLADVDYGMVVLYVFFGGPDTHLFRILPTGYRYIHTLTAMQQSDYQQP